MHIQKPYHEDLISVILSFFFKAKLLHAYVKCVGIVKIKYQIAPSKAVVAVDTCRPMEALSNIYACAKAVL